MFKKKKTFVSHLFGSTVFADFYFNTAWCRIAADIKVKVKRARRLQAIYNLWKSRKIQTTPHHSDTVITGVTSDRLTSGKISSPSQP